MLKSLFSSNTRVELLRLFVFNPQESYYLRQIEQKLSIPLRAIQREIENLCNIGLLIEKISGNRKYYYLNKLHPIRNELKNIILKSGGLADSLGDRLAYEKDIDLAFIYGSYAKNNESSLSDIDLFVIGDISGRNLSSLLSKEKLRLVREINFSLYSRKDFISRIKSKNHFILSVLKSPKIFIIGDNNDLKTIVARRKA